MEICLYLALLSLLRLNFVILVTEQVTSVRYDNVTTLFVVFIPMSVFIGLVFQAVTDLSLL